MIKAKGGSITKARLSNTLLGKELYRAGLTQEAFAEKVGISARYVRILCTKDVNVSIAVYYEILKVLNLPADSLLIYVDEAHKKITLPARKGKKHEYKKSVLLHPLISQTSHSSLTQPHLCPRRNVCV